MNETPAGASQVVERNGKVERLYRVLKLRLAISQAATSKYEALTRTEVNDRVYETTQCWGAPRTGRWAGRILQIHNLRRPPKGLDLELLVADVKSGAFENRDDAWEEQLDQLGGAVRSAIRAGPGKTLVVADLTSIEPCVLAWISRNPEMLRIFREGLDPYKAFASVWLGKDYKDVTKEERNLSKPPALGCGYGLGAKGLIAYAASMGIEIGENMAGSAVRTFRATYRQVPALWRAVESKFKEIIFRNMPLLESHVSGLIIRKEGPMITIELPSGRKLYYHKPMVLNGEITYEGMDQYTRKWERLRTYGAKLVENIVQAIAKDILTQGLSDAEDLGLQVVMHLHDEIVCETMEEYADTALQRLIAAMTGNIPWARGLPLAAKGYTSERYRKD